MSEAPRTDVGASVDALLADPGLSAVQRRLFRSMLETVEQMLTDGTEIIDLKVADTALSEMADAFRMFQPYRTCKKVTIFGSARTQPHHPDYNQARDFAAVMADAGWMVVTGAGQGIMAAGMEGAGREQSIGVNIRLPFESGANPFIAQDPKLVEMRYFFTRKLMLIKESDAFVALPGGFGTLDEAFELLTLLQTGKAEPAPVVMLDTPGGSYWTGWSRFLADKVEPRNLVSPEDASFYRVTDDIEVAAQEIEHFYRNYQGCRWVGDLLVMRLRHEPDDDQLAELNAGFADLLDHGSIRRTKPLAPERQSGLDLNLPRVALRFNHRDYGRLRQLINALNDLPRLVRP